MGQVDIHLATAKRASDGKFTKRVVEPGDMHAAIDLLRGWRRESGDGQRAIAVHSDGSAALHDLADRRVAFYADALDAALAVTSGEIAWQPLPKVVTPKGYVARAR
jgi:hypothetical protein